MSPKDSADPDGPLVRRAKDGDYKAFEELLKMLNDYVDGEMDVAVCEE